MTLESIRRRQDQFTDWYFREATADERFLLQRNFAMPDGELIQLLIDARTDLSLEAVADLMTTELTLPTHRPIKELARVYRPVLERHGLVRPKSTVATARRRFQQFLAKHVYPRIPLEELAPDVRKGRETGGRRAASDSRSGGSVH